METQIKTILNVEIPGFEDLSANFSSDGFNAFLKDYYELTETSIRLNDGQISNFSGENFLAVFIHKNSDSSLKALEAVNEFRERFELFLSNQKSPLTADFKAGISTDSAIIGEVAAGDKKQLTVMGQAVNHAKRLSEFADKGQILVNEKVYEKTSGQFIFQKLEPLPIRGSKETLSVYLVTGKKRKKLQPGSFSKRQIDSEMVGRSHEMEQLESHFRNLLEGKGSIVNIVGKAGIGKSRLMAEIKVQPIMDKLILLEGRALSTGKNLSFHPIVHLIKSWVGITEEDSPFISAEKLHAGILKVAPEQADDIYTFLATMMGFPLTGKYKDRILGIEGDALEKLILKNLRDLIISATKDKPRIYLIEDMHWSDSSSITMFESLYKLSVQYPVMFINVLRPGYKETGDYMLKYLVDNFSGNHYTILVSPLEESDSVQLISNLLRKAHLPKGVEETIIHKTEGNPFFIEEVIRSFIDDGIIETDEKEFRIADKINEVNIPETINDVILSRVDKLDEKTKELLKTASVIGRNFYYKVLEEAADTIGELDERLEYLKDVQLLSESKKKEEIEYLFKHALAQQATYESILMDSKKDLHLKIARSIEKVFHQNLNEFYGTLAYHYEKGENLEKTEEYLIKAGEEAMHSGASTEAIQYFLIALEGIRNKESQSAQHKKILDVEEKLAYAYFANGQNVNSAELFNSVLRSYNLTATPTNQLSTQLKVLGSMIMLRLRIKSWNGKFKHQKDKKDDNSLKLLLYRGEAIATYSPKEAFLHAILVINKVPMQRLVNSNYGAGVLLELSTVFPWSGRAIGFGKLLNQFASSIVDDQNIQVWLIEKYVGVMFEYFTGILSPDSDDEKAFRLGMETGQVWAPTIYLSFKSISLVELGLKEQAKSVIENMNILVTTLENSLSLTQYFRAKQTFLLKFRKLDELIKNSDEFITFCEKTDHTTLLFMNYCLAAMAFCLKNNISQAWNFYRKAEELQKTLWLNYYVSITLLTKAFIEYTEIKLTNKKISKEALDKFSTTTKALVKATKKVNCTKTEAYRFRALSYQFLGDPEKALVNYKKSIDFALWYGAKIELSRTYFELGKFLSDPKTKHKQLNGLSGKDYLEKAKAMFEEMDLQWDLEEYNKYPQIN